MTWPPFIADRYTWAMACGAPISGLSTYERAQKPSLSSAECPEDALIHVRRVRIVGEVRLILVRSRENRQQLGKRGKVPMLNGCVERLLNTMIARDEGRITVLIA
jgi:hypothetical protein